MTKPHGRKIKARVSAILLEPHRETAMRLLGNIPAQQLTGPLFSHFYHGDERVKFRSVAAMGVLVSKMSQSSMEQARIVLRRIMWNLNDESGGIGWGSPEAMGEILGQSPGLAMEFKSILFSYLDPGGNFIEHELLQRGVLWGIGTFLGAFPHDLDRTTEHLIFDHLNSADPIKRGYALRALSHAGCIGPGKIPEALTLDHHPIDIFTDWNFVSTRISDLALAGNLIKKSHDTFTHR